MKNKETQNGKNRKEHIKSLPITGGSGISIKNAIIIKSDAGENYDALEHLAIDLMGISMGITMEVKGQYHVNQNGRYYDIHTVVTSLNDNTYETEIYFDVTDCINK
jgi:hypothetical protein